jgi:hypothetical protein
MKSQSDKAMNSEKAIETARKAAHKLFRGEKVLEISLEEFSRDAKGNWLVTIGVVRPRPQSSKAPSGAREIGFSLPYTRKYKQFTVGGDGKVLAMKTRAA